MGVKTSKTHTENGIAPEDWDMKPLHELAEIRSGGTPSTSLAEFWGSDFHWCTPTDITALNGYKYLYITSRSISMLGLKNSSAELIPANSILMTSRATVGECAINKVPLTTNQGFKNFVTFENVDVEFLYYLLSTKKQEFVRLSGGSTFLELGKTQLSNFVVAIPAKPEQSAIAEALSDIDNLIDSQEQLIAKKRQLKLGIMQELLRPKDGWVKKSLRDTAILKARIGWQGLTTAEYLKSGNYYLVTGTDFKEGIVDWSNCHYVDQSRYDEDKNIQLRKHDVIVTKDGTIGKVAIVSHLDKPATLNSGVFVIRPVDDSFLPEFFYYLLLSNVFTDFLKQLSAGSTINHLYQKDFVNFVYKTPETIFEQRSFAAVLRDMDEDITATGDQLAKARQIKLGMMQELLTGRIRLV